MRIANNITAQNTYRQLSVTNQNSTKSMEKLSSGSRINRAADDATGLTISEKMRTQIRGMNQAVSNSQDAISLIQTAEGALGETQSILQRMSELTTQAANETLTTDDSAKIQNEIEQLTNQLDDIADNTKFNTKAILNTASSLTFQVGANSGETIEMDLVDATSSTLGVSLTQLSDLSTDVDPSNTASTLNAVASSNLEKIHEALTTVSEKRATFGAVQNRLEYTINSLSTTSENLQSAESRIRDTDMAKEMMNMTKNNILSQAAQSMLAQANQKPQGVLQLLQ